MKRIKLVLTTKQIKLIRIALFEYSGICESDSHVNSKVIDGYQTSKPDKRSGLYILSKDLDRVADSISRQVGELK